MRQCSSEIVAHCNFDDAIDSDDELESTIDRFWNLQRVFNCTALKKNGALCFDNNGLCHPGEDSGTSSEFRNPSAPTFIKVEKIDPIESEFFVVPQERGCVHSVSRAVSRLEMQGEPIASQNTHRQHTNAPNIPLDNHIVERVIPFNKGVSNAVKITRKLGKEGRNDRIYGAQAIELVYVPL